MKIRSNWKPIKLRAIDDQDLEIFSQFLFESIVLPSEINFEEKKQQFAMAVERFTWEHAKEESHLLMQVLSILVINNVEKVDLKNLSNNSKISSFAFHHQFLNFLLYYFPNFFTQSWIGGPRTAD